MVNRTKLALLMAFSFFIASPNVPRVTANGKVEEILGNMQRAASKIKTLNAKLLHQKRNTQIGGRPETYRGEIFFKHLGRNNDRVRINYEIPAGQVLTVNQTEIILYQQTINQCTITSRKSAGRKNEELAFFSAPYSLTSSELGNRYHIAYIGDEHVDGVAASVLELTPKGPSSVRKLKWWVSHSSWLPFKSEAVEANRDISTFTLVDAKTNAPIDTGRFNFKCPAGTKTVRL